MTELKIIRMSDIQAESVDWLWEPYIPRGAISLVQGDGGTGKTTLSLAIAAAITQGDALPGGIRTEPANVIIQNAEDSYPRTIKPKLEQFAADCDRIFAIDEDDEPLCYSDQRIEDIIIEKRANLIVFDPLQAFFGKANMNAANNVRPIMKRLGMIAEQTNCSVLLVGHLHKAGGKSQYRGLGSIDIFAAARSVITVGATAVDENIRAMVHNKSNLAPTGQSQAFGLDLNSGFCWMGEYDITIDELLNGERNVKPENQFTKAQMFLEDILRCRPVAATEVFRQAEEKGISDTTLNRAKKAMGVHSFKNNGKWYWELPIEGEYVEVSQGGQDSQGSHTSSMTNLTILNPESRAV